MDMNEKLMRPLNFGKKQKREAAAAGKPEFHSSSTVDCKGVV